MKWLNREFGYSLLPRDLDGPKPKLDEHEIERHLTHSQVFNDAELRQRIRERPEKYRRRFEEKGVFSALYEFFGKE